MTRNVIGAHCSRKEEEERRPNKYQPLIRSACRHSLVKPKTLKDVPPNIWRGSIQLNLLPKIILLYVIRGGMMELT